MMKVMTIVGTRPEIIKMSLVMTELERHVKHVLVHTGQNYDYELNEIFFEDLGVSKPDYFLNAAGESVAESIGNIISKADKILEKEEPNAVLLYGDTNSCLSVIAAKRRKIPVFHFEAGNRCFDERVPEELNRKVLDHLSDINFPLTEHARRYLINEGIRPDRIIKSGSPMKEILTFFQEKIAKSNVIEDLNLVKGEYFICSIHREENVDNQNNFFEIINSLNAVAKEYDYPVIVSTHPRTKKRLESIKELKLSEKVVFMKPLGFFDYNKLQTEALCVISDSGTITEESSILNFPAITIRQAHERPEGMDAGTLIMSGLKPDDVLLAIRVTLKSNARVQSPLVGDYDVDNYSTKITKAILSYVGYVNRVVWRKYI